MDHMSKQVWDKWMRTADAHMIGQGCKSDYAETCSQVERRKREVNEMLGIIFGCEEMEDLQAMFKSDIKFCDATIAYYKANMPKHK
jgi:hypothetical protein